MYTHMYTLICTTALRIFQMLLFRLTMLESSTTAFRVRWRFRIAHCWPTNENIPSSIFFWDRVLISFETPSRFLCALLRRTNHWLVLFLLIDPSSSLLSTSIKWSYGSYFDNSSTFASARFRLPVAICHLLLEQFEIHCCPSTYLRLPRYLDGCNSSRPVFRRLSLAFAKLSFDCGRQENIV